MIQYRIDRSLLLLMLFLALPMALRAQSDEYLTNSNLRGVHPFGSYQFSAMESINLGTGAVNLRIPLFARPGRGLSDGRTVTYSSKIWVARPIPDLFDPERNVGFRWATTTYSEAQVTGLQRGLLDWTEQYYYCSPYNGNYVMVQSNFIYTSAEGSTHRFPNRTFYMTGGVNCSRMSSSVYPLGTSDSGVMQLDTSVQPFLIRHKNGRQEGGPIKDTNGNVIDGNGDTLRRSFQSLDWQPIARDSDGILRTYQMDYTYISFIPRFPSTACSSSLFISQSSEFLRVVSRITLPNGRFFAFSYDPNFGEITRIDLPYGGYVRYVYSTLPEFDNPPLFAPCRLDSRRLAERRVSADGINEQVWTYSYQHRVSNTFNYVTTVTDPLGNVTIHTFDADGVRELETEVRNGASTPLRRIVRSWTQDSGPVQTDQDATTTYDCKNVRMYAATSTLLDRIPNQMSRTETTYDSFTYTAPLFPSGLPNTFTETRMNVLEFREYDYGDGAVGPLLRKTAFTYQHESDSNYLSRHIVGRVSSRKVYDYANELKAQTLYGYDTTPIAATSGIVQHDYGSHHSGMPYRGNLTSTRSWLNSNNSWAELLHWYDDLGNLVKSRDPLGRETQYSYLDNFSSSVGYATNAYLTQVTLPAAQAGANPEVQRKRYYFHTGLTQQETDARGQSTGYLYDLLDRTLLVTRPDGGKTENRYSDASRLVDVFVSLDGAKSLHAQNVYDALGRLIRTRTFRLLDGNTALDRQYDAAGRLSGVSNPYLENAPPQPLPWTVTGYDALDRPVRIVTPDGAVSATAYAGNLARVTDPSGKSIDSAADAAGRVVLVTEDPGGKNYQTTYNYDVLDNLVRVNQAGFQANQVRQFIHDSLSRLIYESSPETGAAGYNGVTAYTYDLNGNLVYKVDPRSAATTLSYDQLNRLTQKSYAVLADGTATPSVVYTYGTSVNDGLSFGRLKSAGNGISTQTYLYDVMGRVVSQRVSFASVADAVMETSYAYDQAGNVVEMRYPSGRVLRQNYSSTGQLQSLESPSAQRGFYMANRRYWPHSVLASADYGNGLFFSSSYNNRLQVQALRVGSLPNTGGLMDLSYGYTWNGIGTDNNGNIRYVIDTVAGKIFNYEYDALNRLTRAHGSGHPLAQDYSYDRWGNLLQGSVAESQLSSYYQQAKNQRLGMSYDEAGNQKSDERHSYKFDAENRIVSMDGGAALYQYDSQGRRVRRTAAGVTTYYVYGLGGEVLSEFTVDNALPASSLQAPALDVAANYQHADHLGTPRVISSQAAALVSRHDYYPFGQEITPAGLSDGESHKFTGKERDAESSLDYFGARYYSSSLGRFTSPDPLSVPNLQRSQKSRFIQFIANPHNWNAYSYALNDPVNKFDPDGMLTIIIPGTKYNADEWKADSAFVLAVGKTFRETPLVLYWSGINSRAARADAALTLSKYLQSYHFKEGEKLNVVAHSHGGNIMFEASTLGTGGNKLTNLVTLGTPIRNDYAPDTSSISTFISVYSIHDGVQIRGGYGDFFCYGQGECGPAKRTINGANNINANISNTGPIDTHSALWQDLNVWNLRVVPKLNKSKDDK